MNNHVMQSPIFIIGNPRSGTTLLRLMLNSHKDIMVPPECGFAVWWHEKYKQWDLHSVHDHVLLNDFLHDLQSSRKIETWNLDYKKLKSFIVSQKPSSYADLISRVYEFYGMSIGRKFKRWGDKNNFYLKHIALIKKLFPQGYFIHIIRDGRDIACSYISLKGIKIRSKYAPKLPHDIKEIAREWSTNILTIRNSFNILHWENVLEIKYENLVSHPEMELKRICDFLNEPFYRSMLDYYKNPETPGSEPKEFLQWKGKILLKPTDSEIGHYKKKLTPEEINIFNSINKNILDTYQYEI